MDLVDTIPVLARVDLFLSVVIAAGACWFWLSGRVMRRKVDQMLRGHAGAWSSILGDEIEGLSQTILTVEDLMRIEPEREESLMVARIQIAAARDRLVRKKGFLEGLADGTLSPAEVLGFMKTAD